MIDDIIIFSSADWDTKPWTNKQHTAMALAKRGFRVLYVDSTGIRRPGANKSDVKRILRRLWMGFRGTSVVADSIYRCSPLVIPAQKGLWVNALNRGLLCLTLKWHMRRLGFDNVLAWVYNPAAASVLPMLRPKMTIYHCVDDLGAIPGISRSAIERQEHRLADLAQLVFSTSPLLYERWQRMKQGDVYYLPNVADYSHFKSARGGDGTMAEMNTIPSPRIGFVGTLSNYKIDFRLIMDIARKRPDWNWVLIGGEREGQAAPILDDLRRRDNVHILGYRDYNSLPDYMAGMDIATLPMLNNDYTRSMFPMKFFEYLSAGLPVVSTRLPALQTYSRACRLVDNTDEFISAVESIFGGERPDPSYCDRLARQHTYDQRLDVMLKHIRNKVDGMTTMAEDSGELTSDG